MTDFSEFLLVSDFDRTLTDRQSRIPRENLEAILEFEARGGLFTMGTGRSVPMFRPVQAGVPTNAPLILYNGAALYDYRTEALSRPLWIPRGRELLDYLLDAFPALWLELQGLDAHHLFGENRIRDQFYRDQGAAFCPTDRDRAPLPFLKLALFGDFAGTGVAQFFSGEPGDREKFAAIQARIAADWPELVVDRAALRIIDIQRRDATKGSAAGWLADRLGRRLVCVGDAMNDASMLTRADLAFAPADCDPGVKALGCCRLVRSCDEGAIAGVVEALEAL